jgi:hypothetical protein
MKAKGRQEFNAFALGEVHGGSENGSSSGGLGQILHIQPKGWRGISSASCQEFVYGANPNR